MKKNSYTSLLIILSTILLVILGVWGYIFNNILVNKANTNSTLIEIEKQKRDNNNLASVRSLISDVKSNVLTLDGDFIYSDEIAGFVETIEKEAKNADVTLAVGNLNFNKDSVAVVKPLTARIDIEGSWQAVISFIGRIERFPKNIKIDRVNLSRLGDIKEKTTKWKASFDIKASVIDHSTI